jgi:dihydrolipoamide dehydrogenase
VYDLLVIGAGPGGYAAAIRAAQLGLTTALVERSQIGGVCLNAGCIPSKAMLRSAEVLGLLRDGSSFGLVAAGGTVDYGAAVIRREAAVSQLVGGLGTLLKANGVIILQGVGRLTGSHTVEIIGENGSRHEEFADLIVATGSRPASLSLPGANLPGVIDSDGALRLHEAPRRAVIIGAGAVGVEWAEIWRAFGSGVTVVEMMPQMIPTEEPEIARELLRCFGRKGIMCHLDARVREIRAVADGLEVIVEAEQGQSTIAADFVLTAVGRHANLEGLGLDAAGLSVDGRRIETDGHMRTSAPHIYAVGDVTGRSLLAHAAVHQAHVAVDTIAGRDTRPFDSHAVPAAIFTHPEVASVGLRERDATAQGIPVTVARFPFAALGRAVATAQIEGYVKVIADERSGKLLGAHIIGAHAGDLIGEASLAIHLGATVQDVASAIHVHPSFSEAFAEACAVAAGYPLHVAPRRIRAAVRDG